MFYWIIGNDLEKNYIENAKIIFFPTPKNLLQILEFSGYLVKNSIFKIMETTFNRTGEIEAPFKVKVNIISFELFY